MLIKTMMTNNRSLTMALKTNNSNLWSMFTFHKLINYNNFRLAIIYIDYFYIGFILCY